MFIHNLKFGRSFGNEAKNFNEHNSYISISCILLSSHVIVYDAESLIGK